VEFDRAALADLRSRLETDGIVAGLPSADQVRVLVRISGSSFGVLWDGRSGVTVLPEPSSNDTWDFGFDIPADMWAELSKPAPPPTMNTAQALVNKLGHEIVWGDRVKHVGCRAHVPEQSAGPAG
jgi:hypothetical protein